MPKINELTRATALTGTDLLPMDNASGTATKAVSGEQIKAYVTADVSAEVTDLKNAFDDAQNCFLPLSDLISDEYIETNGQIAEYNNWSRTNYIPILQYSYIIAKITANASRYNSFYDKNKNPISSFRVELTETMIEVPANAYFVIFSGQTAAMVGLSARGILKAGSGVVQLNAQMQNTSPTTHNGITYSIENDTISFLGTSSGSINITIEGSLNTIPAWICPNTVYYVDLKSIGYGNVYFDVDLYNFNGTFVKSACKLDEPGLFVTDSLIGIKGAIVRWYIPTGTTVNIKKSAHVYDCPSAYNIIYDMEKAGTLNVNKPSLNIGSTIVNGVTYSVDNNIFSANGTASGNFNLALEGSVNSFPDWLRENTDYTVKIQKSGTGRVFYNIDLYNSNGDYVSSACSLSTSGTFRIDGLSGIYGAIAKYYIPNGSVVSNVSVKTSVYMQKSISDGNGVNLRVMQYNIGKYRWGYSSLSDWGLTEEQYTEYLAKYKRFFGTYRPDILGLQEYVVYMDKAETHNAYDVLFGSLFNMQSAEKTDTHQTRVFGCGLGGNWSFNTFTSNGKSTNWTLGEIYAGGKIIGVATGALTPYDGTGDYYEAREGQIGAILAAMQGYDDVIIMFDTNIKTSAELATFKDIATQNGYLICNGDYWGTIDTYVAHQGVSYPFNAIDNIWVKGNIKIRNFEVLSDEYDNLTSDHIPVIADLYIF